MFISLTYIFIFNIKNALRPNSSVLILALGKENRIYTLQMSVRMTTLSCQLLRNISNFLFLLFFGPYGHGKSCKKQSFTSSLYTNM